MTRSHLTTGALSFGLSAGFLDLIATMHRSEAAFTSFPVMLPPLAVTVTVSGVLFALAGGAAAPVAGRILRVPPLAILAGLGGFGLTLFALGAFAGLFPPVILLESPNLYNLALQAAVYAIAAWFAALGAFGACLAALSGHMTRWIASIVWLMPLVLLEAAAYIYLKDQRAAALPIGVPALTMILLAVIGVTKMAVFAMYRSPLLRVKLIGLYLMILCGAAYAALVPRATALPPRAASPAAAPTPVILITLDALRADALSCYGATRLSTPNIDALAADGLLFREALSPSSWTGPSIASIMTGLPPRVHGNLTYKAGLPNALETLAEHFARSGYRTGAAGYNPLLLPDYGFGQGFGEYEWYPRPKAYRSAGGAVLYKLLPETFAWQADTPRLTAIASDWLARHADGPFFYWLHYYDPHSPWDPPRELLPPEAPARIGNVPPFDVMRNIRPGIFVPTTEERKWMRTLYEAEVRHADEYVGRLLAHLKALGVYDRAIIVLSSDHGEEFWEHRGFEHGNSLYQELLHVPLIVKMPAGGPRGERAELVSTGDLMPTLLELCGVPFDRAKLGGRSFAALLGGGGAWEPRPLLADAPLSYEDREAVLFDGMKYIRFLQSPYIDEAVEELYDLRTDPGERTNLAPAQPDTVRRAQGIVEEHREREHELRMLWGIEEGREISVDRNTVEELEAVGYL